MEKHILSLFIGVFCINIVWAQSPFSPKASQTPPLKVSYNQTGQGNCVLLKCPNGDFLLVDCGSSSKDIQKPNDNIREVIESIQNKVTTNNKITIIITHLDEDHYNLVPDIFPLPEWKNKIKKVIIGIGPQRKSTKDVNWLWDHWIKLLNPSVLVELINYEANKDITNYVPNLCEGAEIRLMVVNAMERQNLGVKVYPGEADHWNANSIILKAGISTITNCSTMLTGDGNVPVSFRELLEIYDEIHLKTTIMLATHHGAAPHTNTDEIRRVNQTWARKTNPSTLVFSSGYATYGHPRCSTIENYNTNSSLISTNKHKIPCFNGIITKTDDTNFKKDTQMDKAVYSTYEHGNVKVKLYEKGVFRLKTQKSSAGAPLNLGEHNCSNASMSITPNKARMLSPQKQKKSHTSSSSQNLQNQSTSSLPIGLALAPQNNSSLIITPIKKASRN